jgi:23S rRNA pseudouridine1911/1915/1917 synthase
MREAHHPLAGDPLYGNPRHKASDEAMAAVKALGRQALHAFSLSLTHPVTGETMSWKSRLPQDMRDLLTLLREESAAKLNKSAANPLLDEDDEDDWDEDDYDVEVHYVR